MKQIIEAIDDGKEANPFAIKGGYLGHGNYCNPNPGSAQKENKCNRNLMPSTCKATENEQITFQAEKGTKCSKDPINGMN